MKYASWCCAAWTWLIAMVIAMDMGTLFFCNNGKSMLEQKRRMHPRKQRE